MIIGFKYLLLQFSILTFAHMVRMQDD